MTQGNTIRPWIGCARSFYYSKYSNKRLPSPMLDRWSLRMNEHNGFIPTSASSNGGVVFIYAEGCGIPCNGLPSNYGRVNTQIPSYDTIARMNSVAVLGKPLWFSHTALFQHPSHRLSTHANHSIPIHCHLPLQIRTVQDHRSLSDLGGRMGRREGWPGVIVG
jgi:hypothetical protein